MGQLKRFLKDQRLDFVGYSCVTLLILFFFYLKNGKEVEIIYPLILTVFVVGVITLIKGVRYYQFHKALEQEDYKVQPWNGASCQEQECMRKIDSLQKHHHNEICSLMKEREDSNAFVAQLVHDMKIPLSLIKLVLDDLEQGESMPANEQENILKMKKGNEQVLQKLSQVLCYLRLGQFEKDYVIERVNLIEEIRNAINLKKEYFILNKCYPRFDTMQPALWVLTDRKWHGMLLDQIISNAIKYSAVKATEGYIRFDVNCSEDKVALTITDDGIGIPPYDMERIFEAFFTGENGRKVGNSSGIGLYLCKVVCEKLNHRIEVTSDYGIKTVVTLTYLTKL